MRALSVCVFFLSLYISGNKCVTQQRRLLLILRRRRRRRLLLLLNKMHRNDDSVIDLGVWFRRLVLAAVITFVCACSVKVGATFWEGWKLGTVQHAEAGRTLDQCATGRLTTSHFLDGCSRAQRERAKDPLIYAIEYTWRQTWPCESAFCVEGLARLTHSIWTILAVALFMACITVYFTGCAPMRQQNPVMWAWPPTATPYMSSPQSGPTKSSQYVVDVEKLLQSKAD